MAKVIIPAVTVSVCDKCGARSDDHKAPFRYGSCHMRVESRGEQAGSSYDVDLCEKCENDFNKWMKSKDSRGG